MPASRLAVVPASGAGRLSITGARSRIQPCRPHAFEKTEGGELIVAGGTGNGFRLAELAAANNPSRWSCVIKVNPPAGTTPGCILLYANP